MTKKEVKVLDRTRQSDVLNQSFEQKTLLSIPFPQKEEHTINENSGCPQNKQFYFSDKGKSRVAS